MNRISPSRPYFAFLAFSALIFAQRAFAVRDILARTAADMVRLPCTVRTVDITPWGYSLTTILSGDGTLDCRQLSP